MMAIKSCAISKPDDVELVRYKICLKIEDVLKKFKLDGHVLKATPHGRYFLRVIGGRCIEKYSKNFTARMVNFLR
jgi:hypothetical protein